MTVLALAIALTSSAVSAQALHDEVDARHAAGLADRGWVWPSAAFRLVRPFQAPAHAYGAGHRGIDLEAVDSFEVRSPAAGTVAFSGPVAGRGILTIEHGDGLVTTLEPINSDLRPGATLRSGDAVGTIALGGHTAAGALHFGVRLHGEYVNPMLLLGDVPRAVLLPCC
ncbi:M23 family metallopeptidase [Microbacterium sp. CFH 31415]|uniref:murein hydrolase activator EnvC family protein n=1 Tax=Microbacterium sp. CFH 31415 TaxID=2921732 RepID=UPI001F130F34|nr:M23 family metallopeptidase [Microbacterium sp. CFH 31415]MCH6229350.1 M23 family metallopeptidase [Microbacterium sp. CFH 31415]